MKRVPPSMRMKEDVEARQPDDGGDAATPSDLRTETDASGGKEAVA